MTEDQAKTKWCPAQGIGVKTAGEARKRAVCIGSECMAWRWDKPEESPDGTFDADRHDGFMKEDSGRKFIYHGYCGLAGKPE